MEGHLFARKPRLEVFSKPYKVVENTDTYILLEEFVSDGEPVTVSVLKDDFSQLYEHIGSYHYD